MGEQNEKTDSPAQQEVPESYFRRRAKLQQALTGELRAGGGDANRIRELREEIARLNDEEAAELNSKK